VEDSQPQLMTQRGVDLTMFSPRTSATGHHAGDADTNLRWSRA